MNASRWWLAAFGIATTLVVTGCSVCGPEQHAITVGSINALNVTGGPAALTVGSSLRLVESQFSSSTFDFVYETLKGSRSGEGIALSFSGSDRSSSEQIWLVLAVPVSLRPGDEYSVGATFAVEPGTSDDPKMWGAYDLRQSNQAEVSFAVVTYSFPPPVYTTNFRAVKSTGTIRVTQRTTGSVELSLNLTFTNAAGSVRALIGSVQASADDYAATCT